MKSMARWIALLLLSLCGTVVAQGYPDRPVRVVMGFGAGGGADVLLRTFLPRFSENLGAQLVVDYRVGAGGNIAMETVARAAADGYTLLMGTPGLATNPSLYANMSFDPLRDFAPVSLVGAVQNVLVVHPSLPVNTVQELVAWAKARPGKLNIASAGTGTSIHLAAELFRMSTGIEYVHIPYKGGAQAMTDVMGGQADMMFNVLPSALPGIKAGKVKALAVTGRTRSDALPNVPTMQEAGVAGYTAVTWNGILAPAGTPREIVAKLNAALVKALRSPEMKEKFAAIGQDPLWSTPEEFASFMREETERWSKVIKAAGIKAQ